MFTKYFAKETKKYISAVFLLITSSFILINSKATGQSYYNAAINGNYVCMRAGAGASYKTLKTFKRNEQIKTLELYKNWYKIIDNHGKIGYVYKKYVKVSNNQGINDYAYKKPVSNNTLKGSTASAKTNPVKVNVQVKPTVIQVPSANIKPKVNLVWDPDYLKTAKGDMSVKGLNVISPTWFALKDYKGNLTDGGSKTYTDKAHSKNLKVWALISNNFDPDLTDAFLKNPVYRGTAISNLISLCKRYNLDGINLDFEKMYGKDRDYFTQFVKELSKETSKNKLTLSIDVTVITNSYLWSQCFDRKSLASIADYVMVMTYDEHTKGSDPGSVADLAWVENNIKAMIAQVPSSKLVLGIPFYTRLWSETLSNTNSYSVDSQVLTMDQATQIIADNKAKTVWDDKLGQYYAEYIKDGKKYMIWMENSKSIDMKTLLISKYKLAGCAAWRKGFENINVWDVISRNYGL